MENKTYKILVMVIAFGAGIFATTQFQSCIHDEVTNSNICFKDSTIYKTETKTVIDTIPFVYKKPIKINKKNSNYDSSLNKQCDKLSLDSINISDSLINGFVKTEVKNNQLKNFSISYKPLFPKYIKKDSIIINTVTEYNTTYEPYKQNIVYLGGSVGTNDIGVLLSIKNKKDLIYGYKFGITYNGLKTHNIEFKLPIFKSKQQTNKNN